MTNKMRMEKIAKMGVKCICNKLIFTKGDEQRMCCREGMSE